MAYLDDTGLAYFWGKIKAWANSVFALLGHTHPASDVTLMTGYSKPSSGSAIASSDTLNQAVGKLEAKVDDALDDSNYVHLTGDETIADTKTFTSDIKITKSTPRIVETASNLERGNYTSSSATYGDLLAYNDKNNRSLFRLYSTVVNSNSNYFSILVYPIANTNNTYVTFKTGYDGNGIAFASATSTPLPADRNDGNDILTRNWIPNDTRIVHTSGAETVAGQKTFVSDLILGNHDVRAPSNDTYCCFAGGAGESYDKGGALFVYGVNYVNDSDSDAQAGAFNLRSVTGTTHYDLFGNKAGLLTWRGNSIWAGISNTGSGNAVTSISIGSDNVVTVAKGSTFLTALTNVSEMGRYIDFHYDNATAAYNYDVRLGCSSQGTSAGGGNLTITANAVYAPNPASDANDTRVATTFWVNSSCVKLSGDQNIGGAKTFTSDITIQNNAPYMYIKQNDVQAGTTPDSSYSGIYFVDKNDKAYGSVISRFYGGQNGCVELIGYQVTSASATGQANVRVCHHSTVGKIMEPDTNGDILLGRSSHRWKEIWCTQSSINSSSDERDKTAIDDIPNEVLDVWENVSWLQFKFKDAVKEKLDNARLHTGVVAQYIDKAFKDKGLDISRYGLFLYDKWEKEEDEDYDENENLRHAASLAGDSYGIRYVEALCMDAAYMRRENARLKERLAALEERLAALEMK